MCELDGNEICSVWCLTAGFNVNVIKPKYDAFRVLTYFRLISLYVGPGVA